jgi:hypothetical protein
MLVTSSESGVNFTLQDVIVGFTLMHSYAQSVIQKIFRIDLGGD